jgi:rubrerythrin
MMAREHVEEYKRLVRLLHEAEVNDPDSEEADDLRGDATSEWIQMTEEENDEVEQWYWAFLKSLAEDSKGAT